MDAQLIEVREKEEAPCGASESGPSRARTGDLIPARDALSQLSYGPAELRQCSSELEIASPANSRVLVVLRRRQPQIDLTLGYELTCRKEETARRIRAVDTERVELAERISAVDHAVRPTPGGVK